MTSESLTTFKEASRQYRESAGEQYRKPDRERSYLRDGAMHLLSGKGELLAVVFTDGTVTHGAALNAWSRQLSAGMPAPRR